MCIIIHTLCMYVNCITIFGITGEGCMVTVLSHDGKALCRFRAFPDSNVIHGFRIHPSSGFY